MRLIELTRVQDLGEDAPRLPIWLSPLHVIYVCPDQVDLSDKQKVTFLHVTGGMIFVAETPERVRGLVEDELSK